MSRYFVPCICIFPPLSSCAGILPKTWRRYLFYTTQSWCLCINFNAVNCLNECLFLNEWMNVWGRSPDTQVLMTCHSHDSWICKHLNPAFCLMWQHTINPVREQRNLKQTRQYARFRETVLGDFWYRSKIMSLRLKRREL